MCQINDEVVGVGSQTATAKSTCRVPVGGKSKDVVIRFYFKNVSLLPIRAIHGGNNPPLAVKCDGIFDIRIVTKPGAGQ
jgi:hypothetical protein